jgi:hypothetical protein
MKMKTSLIAVIFLVWLSSAWSVQYNYTDEDIKLYARIMERNHGWPEYTIESIIDRENPGWDSRAVSRANSNGTRDLGLCQLNDKYIPEFVEKYWWPNRQYEFDWRDPYSSIFICVSILSANRSHLMEAMPWDNIEYLAIASYNVGLGSIKYSETRRRVGCQYANNVYDNRRKKSNG